MNVTSVGSFLDFLGENTHYHHICINISKLIFPWTVLAYYRSCTSEMWLCRLRPSPGRTLGMCLLTSFQAIFTGPNVPALFHHVSLVSPISSLERVLRGTAWVGKRGCVLLQVRTTLCTLIHTSVYSSGVDRQIVPCFQEIDPSERCDFYSLAPIGQLYPTCKLST